MVWKTPIPFFSQAVAYPSVLLIIFGPKSVSPNQNWINPYVFVITDISVSTTEILFNIKPSLSKPLKQKNSLTSFAWI